MIFDPLYMLILAIGGGLSLWASMLTKSRFNHYKRYGVSSGLSGAQAADTMLKRAGLHDVGIERVGGFLSDHYDPRHRVLRLSPDVYDGRTMSAIGVACHEAGHALQHANNYGPLSLRSALVPAANFGSSLGMWVLVGGIMLGGAEQAGLGSSLVTVGVMMFSAAVLFSLVTLPVEWDASARARKQMVAAGIVTAQEEPHAAKVLNAAFLTYLAAAISSVLTLLYWLYRAGLIGGRSND